MARSNEEDGAGLEEAGPVVAKGLRGNRGRRRLRQHPRASRGPAAGSSAEPGTPGHGWVQGCRPGRSERGLSVGTMQGGHVAPGAGRCMGARHWMMHGCKVLGDARVQGTG